MYTELTIKYKSGFKSFLLKLNKIKKKINTMLNLQTWFSNYTKSESFKSDYKNILKSPHLTSKNIKDFNNPNYNLTKLDILKYTIVLEYLASQKYNPLIYKYNPYLINEYKPKKNEIFYAHNDFLEINQYKNMIIDLFFSEIPELAKTIPLNVLWGLVKDKTEITPYSNEIKEVHKAGYGFNYFGGEGTSILYSLFLKSFYQDIKLYPIKIRS